jgi:ribosome-associated protein
MKVTVKKKENYVPVVIGTEFIKLEAALKFANAVESGGMAKTVIQGEEVLVNGEVCTMRGKKLYPGDVFTFDGQSYLISIHATV